MSPTSTVRPDFVPIESIIAFVFIGVMVLVGLIARCLALNQSTIRSAQSLDLVIYKEAPRAPPVSKAKYSSSETQFESNGDVRERGTPTTDPAAPARIQRGPKNL